MSIKEMFITFAAVIAVLGVFGALLFGFLLVLPKIMGVVFN